MAGSGRRTFAAGEVLTASNVMNYLMDQSVMSFAGTAARGSAIGSAVAQGMTTFQQDTGKYETYHLAYGTAAGQSLGGRDSAGWYDTRKTDGLIPIRPTSYTAVTGSATINALGKVSFTNVSRINLSGVFSSKFSNYKIVYTLNSYSNPIDTLGLLLSSSGTDNTLSDYSYGGWYVNRDAGNGAMASNSVNRWVLCSWNGSYPTGGGAVDIINPYVSGVWTSYQNMATSSYRLGIEVLGGAKANENVFDGFSLVPASSLIRGTVQVYGYNE